MADDEPRPARPPDPGRPRAGALRPSRALLVLAVAAAVVVTLVAVTAGGDGEEAAPPRGAGATGSTTTTAPGPPAPDPGEGAARPLGTVTASDDGTTCLPGAARCVAFSVACPGLSTDAVGELDVRPAAQPRGVVVLFTGSNGGRWWADEGRGDLDYLAGLGRDGLITVQVRWKRGSWLDAAPGEEAGTAAVACRPATVIRWVHDEVYAPLGLTPAPLTCGFCVTGNSGGASQVTYPLAYYGLEAILDVVVATAGPPHAALAAGCLRRPGEEALWYDENTANGRIDDSFGFAPGTGPCARRDASYVDRWRAESIDTGGNDYYYPDTLVQFFFGTRDETGAVPHGQTYVDALRTAGSPHVATEVLEGVPHSLNADALTRVRAVLERR